MIMAKIKLWIFVVGLFLFTAIGDTLGEHSAALTLELRNLQKTGENLSVELILSNRLSERLLIPAPDIEGAVGNPSFIFTDINGDTIQPVFNSSIVPSPHQTSTYSFVLLMPQDRQVYQIILQPNTHYSFRSQLDDHFHVKAQYVSYLSGHLKFSDGKTVQIWQGYVQSKTLRYEE